MMKVVHVSIVEPNRAKNSSHRRGRTGFSPRLPNSQTPQRETRAPLSSNSPTNAWRARHTCMKWGQKLNGNRATISAGSSKISPSRDFPKYLTSDLLPGSSFLRLISFIRRWFVPWSTLFFIRALGILASGHGFWPFWFMNIMLIRGPFLS